MRERSVMLRGVPVTRERMVMLLGERARLCPVDFDVATRMSMQDSAMLSAFLRRNGIDVSVSRPRLPTAASRGRQRHGDGHVGLL